MSGRIESACPSLMKNGPSETMMLRSSATDSTSAAEPGESSPFSARIATPLSHPADVPMIWPIRVSTASGRFPK